MFKIKSFLLSSLLLVVGSSLAEPTFVHPGITLKTSDLDRVKYMVEAQVDPWYASYQEMAADSKASYNYTVRGDPSFTELGRDDGTNYNEWNDDIRAAYYNAIRWYVTGDSRHAEKSIEIFNAWTNLTSVTSGGTQALSGGIGYIMIEAAEIIKSTYSGWSESEIQAFKDMLVYPGYSTTAEPAGISRVYGSFYWQSYQGDPVRHGNQGLAGWRTVMAMGIFMDNEIMYDRALRYIQGLPHRPDDLPYPPGPSTATSISSEGDYADTWNYTQGTSIEDYGYNEVMTNYIWETGQCQESSRDQQHTVFGIGILCAMSEMAWNQGDDLYSHANDRLLLGLEYTMKYNVSYLQSYPDQTEWWVPTVASGEFQQGFNAPQRVYSKSMSPTHVGGFPEVRPVFEMPIAHFSGRGFKTAEEVKWTVRARDYALDTTGYEAAGHQNGAIGWGALIARRPALCYGDPIDGFSAGVPDFAMHVIPATIEAENYDFSPVAGDGRTYHDLTAANSGGAYRLNEGVDIATCSEGGYQLTDVEADEWVSYTVNVDASGSYTLEVRYAAAEETTIRFSFAGSDVTSDVRLPSTGSATNWVSVVVGQNIPLNQGVQCMRLYFSETAAAFGLNSVTISPGPAGHIEAENFGAMSGVVVETCSDENGGDNLGYIENADWCRYDTILLDGATVFRARVARRSGRPDGRIEVRLDSPGGIQIGSVDVPETGGWQVWQTVETSLTPVAGTHSIYLVFVEVGTSTGDALFNLNWFGLEMQGTPSGLAATPASAAEIDLGWNAATGVSYYNLKRSVTSGGPYTVMGCGPSSTNYMDSGLLAGTNYYYVISAVYSGSESADSAEVTAVPSALLHEDDVVIGPVVIGDDGAAGQLFSVAIGYAGLGHNYQVWTNGSLESTTWQIASEVYSGTGGELQIDVAVDPTQTNCFYKLEAWRQ